MSQGCTICSNSDDFVEMGRTLVGAAIIGCGAIEMGQMVVAMGGIVASAWLSGVALGMVSLQEEVGPSPRVS